MKTVWKLLFAGLWVVGPGTNAAEAGTAADKKVCETYRADRIVMLAKRKGIDIEVTTVTAGASTAGESEMHQTRQELPDDVLREGEALFRKCMAWKQGLLSKKDFENALKRGWGMQTDHDRRMQRLREKQAERRARKGESSSSKRRKRTQSSSSDSSFNQKFKRLLMWTGGTALAGGGAVVYFTSKTAKENQSEYGPEDEWEELQRLNTIGWQALAGGAVVFYVGAKIQVHATGGMQGSGLYLQGAF